MLIFLSRCYCSDVICAASLRAVSSLFFFDGSTTINALLWRRSSSVVDEIFSVREEVFNFQKPHWDVFASYFDSHCTSAEEYSSLAAAAALSTSLVLNATKSSIPFGRIKRHPKARWSAEVEEAVSERRKAFAAVHRSNEKRQVYISTSDVHYLSSPRPKQKHGRRLTLLSGSNLTLNLCTLSSSLCRWLFFLIFLLNSSSLRESLRSSPIA